MITITPKISDVDIPNDTFYCYVGNHGHPISISRLKQMVAKSRHEEVTTEMVYAICVKQINAKAIQLGVQPKDLSMAQIKSAIEVSVEV